MSGHTPGPWTRDPYDGADMQVVAHGNEVVVWHRRHPRQEDSRVVANHCLIAAAPDLLGLLQELAEANPVVTFPHMPGDPLIASAWSDRARAVISRATGEARPDFIAHARADLPDSLAHSKRQAEVIRGLVVALSRWEWHGALRDHEGMILSALCLVCGPSAKYPNHLPGCEIAQALSAARELLGEEGA